MGVTACAGTAAEPRVTAESYYTNDYHIPGAGYFHAPFGAFYPLPYNHYDAQRNMYFYGGQWGPAPHRSIVNISTPTAESARLAQSRRTDLPPVVPIVRHGFGSTSGSRFIHS